MADVTQILLPDIGDFEDVEVVEVLVKPGQKVQKDDSLLVIESEKASVEVPSPHAGVIREILVKVGDKVSKGSPICKMEVEESRGGVSPAPASAEGETEGGAKGRAPAPPPPPKPAPSPAPRSAPAAPPPPPPTPAGPKPLASPSVRRFARELGVDLAHVPGTGGKGRILKEDVQRYVKHAMSVAGTPTGTAFAVMETPQIDFTQFGSVHLEPLTKIQKVAGRNLHRSWVGVPHVTQHDEADITDLEDFRRQMQQSRSKNGVKLTFVSFFIKAVGVVLKEYPKFNSSLDAKGENLIVKEYFHIGIAVDTPNGLVVPVIRDVNHKGIVELAKELADVSTRARARRLAPQDLQGACISISSLGGIGGTFFTPIINPPEVAVLGIGQARMRPVWQKKKFVPRLLCPLSLSYDHRVIDGADAARFTTRLKQVLEDVRQIAL